LKIILIKITFKNNFIKYTFATTTKETQIKTTQAATEKPFI
jgi:hypothetical protein